MSKYNPEIENQLDALAELCCESLEGYPEQFADRCTPLLDALMRSGFGRDSETPLSVELEQRIAEHCRDPRLHRGGSISSLTAKIQSQFDDQVRWQSNKPSRAAPPQAANLNSASHATNRQP